MCDYKQKIVCGRGTSNRINLCCGSAVFVGYFVLFCLGFMNAISHASNSYRESLFCKSLVEIGLFYPVLFQDLHWARFTILTHLLTYLLMLLRTKLLVSIVYSLVLSMGSKQFMSDLVLPRLIVLHPCGSEHRSCSKSQRNFPSSVQTREET